MCDKCNISDKKQEKSALAREYFFKGYNCSQSVAAAWCDEMGLDLKTVLKISSGFGAGIGRMREVCGAFSGAVMVLGMLYGNINGSDPKAKGENYALVQRFAKRFKEENNFDSIICREMLGLSGPDKPMPEKRTNEYYKKRPCPDLIAMSSGLLCEFVYADKNSTAKQD